MKFIYDDGGRKLAGFEGAARDCVARSIAIVSKIPYMEVYDGINRLADKLKHKSSARSGVMRKTYHTYLTELGYKWYPTMRIGSGCKVHLNPDELPKGRLILKLSKHLTAVIDGVIHDTHDPSRNQTRCVYGYFSRDLNGKGE